MGNKARPKRSDTTITIDTDGQFDAQGSVDLGAKDPRDTMATQHSFVLQRLTYHAGMSFTMCAIPMLTDAQIDASCRALVVGLTQHVLGEKLKVVEHSYPSDWWQAFKARWYPRRWLKRWPVKHTTVRLKAAAVYPLISLPEQGQHVVLSKWVGDG